MRKVGAFKEEVQAVGFIQYLQKNNITALIEEDDGSYAIWVHDEGHINKAKSLFDELKEKGPDFLQQQAKHKKKSSTKIKPPSFTKKKPSSGQLAYQGYITKGLLIICVAIFVIATVQKYRNKDQYQGMAGLPAIAKELLIDYPKSDQILDQLIQTYGVDRVKNNNLPSAAQPLIAKFNQTTPWVGIYNILLSPKEKKLRLWNGQLFEKIRSGQLWRIFTPAILHLGLLHLLFNILWLAVLGKMVEFNMGRVKFLLFILTTGIVSNVCQYFMTGPYFMGISGVLSAFIGYIWIRKKIAPWEVYLVGKETLHFFLIFILGFLGLQIAAFFLQLFNIFVLPLAIANTGHISGLLSGIFLGKLGIFTKK